jgi:hypothetical protein
MRIHDDKVDTSLCNYKPSVHGGYQTYFVVSQAHSLTISVSTALGGLLHNLRPFMPSELKQVYDLKFCDTFFNCLLPQHKLERN